MFYIHSTRLIVWIHVICVSIMHWIVKRIRCLWWCSLTLSQVNAKWSQPICHCSWDDWTPWVTIYWVSRNHILALYRKNWSSVYLLRLLRIFKYYDANLSLHDVHFNYSTNKYHHKNKGNLKTKQIEKQLI